MNTLRRRISTVGGRDLHAFYPNVQNSVVHFSVDRFGAGQKAKFYVQAVVPLRAFESHHFPIGPDRVVSSGGDDQLVPAEKDFQSVA